MGFALAAQISQPPDDFSDGIFPGDFLPASRASFSCSS
jgi:hypothetical protein